MCISSICIWEFCLQSYLKWKTYAFTNTLWLFALSRPESWPSNLDPRAARSLAVQPLPENTALTDETRFSISPLACSHISTISLHLLLDRWKQVGEPWVSFTRGARWKAQYDVILRPPSVPISAPALVWVCSQLQGQTKRGTAAGCQGNTGATHTHIHTHRWYV